MVLSRDEKRRLLLVANGAHISVFDTTIVGRERALLNDIELEPPVAGMVIAGDNSLYAYVPGSKSQRFFAYSPAGLKPQ
jgi:hypothetical protein